MNAFKNSNTFDGGHGPGGGSGGGGFHGPGAVLVEVVFTVQAIQVSREVTINNPAKAISNNSPDIRAIQNS